MIGRNLFCQEINAFDKLPLKEEKINCILDRLNIFTLYIAWIGEEPEQFFIFNCWKQ